MRNSLAIVLAGIMLFSAAPINADELSANSYFEEELTSGVTDGQYNNINDEIESGTVYDDSSSSNMIMNPGNEEESKTSLDAKDSNDIVVEDNNKDGDKVPTSAEESIPEELDTDLRMVGAGNNNCGENVTWSLSSGTLTISGEGAMYDYTSYENTPWNSRRREITKVVLSEGVTTIGDHAFEQCDMITSVEFPATLTRIGDVSFMFCMNIKNLDNIPDGVTYIGEKAFANCHYLESVHIPLSLKTIKAKAFSMCFSKLTSVIIPEGVEDIEAEAFYACNHLSSITLPSTLKTIGDEAFNSTGIKTFVFGDKVTSIGEEAFANNSDLQTVYFCGNAPSLGKNCFHATSGVIAYFPSNNPTYTEDIRENGAGMSLSWRTWRPDTGEEDELQGACGVSAEWKLENGVLYISGSGEMYDFEETSVQPWSHLEAEIYSIEVENGITYIGKNAFGDLGNVTDVFIGNSVQSVAAYAFSGCYSLSTIIFTGEKPAFDINTFCLTCDAYYPSAVQSWANWIDSANMPFEITGDVRWKPYDDLTSIPISVAMCGDDAVSSLYPNGDFVISGSGKIYESVSFEDSRIKRVIVEEGITNIAGFFDCKNLTTVILSSSVTRIENRAFENCISLLSFDIPLTVLYIGNSAFSGCSSLRQIIIPEKITKINSSTFSGCSELNSITLCNGITSIEANAFNGCAALESVILPSKVESIGMFAFANCTELQEISIPDTVTVVGGSAFSNCSSLSVLKLSEKMTELPDGIFENCKSLTSVTVPQKINLINSYAFNGCSALESLYVKSSEISIPMYFMSGCEKIREIVFEGNVTSVAAEAFRNIGSLQKVLFNGQLSCVSDYMFKDCVSLQTVTIPEGTTSIGEYAFDECVSLSTISLPESISSIGESGFAGCTSLQTLDISKTRITCVEKYIFADTKISNLVLPDTVQTIGEDGLAFMTKLRTVVLPNGLKKIEASGFQHCENLFSVTIPDSVTEIGESAFFECEALNSVTLPDGMTAIPSGLFMQCFSLKNVSLPITVKRIGSYSFFYCRSLENLELPSAVTHIDNNAFAQCYNLRMDVFPSVLEVIGNEAFASCKAFTSIEIPSSVMTIGEGAFKYCYNLNTMKFLGDAPILNTNCFLQDVMTVRYPVNNSSWIPCLDNQYGGTITWKPWPDPSDEEDLNNLHGYAYTDEDWANYVIELNKNLQFFCNRGNFLHVKYINDNDNSFFGKFEYNFANFIKLTDGWKEILSGTSSIEDAEQILYAMLFETAEKTKEISTAKTGQKAAKYVLNIFDYTLKGTAYEAIYKDYLVDICSKKEFEDVLTGKGTDYAMDFIESKLSPGKAEEFRAAVSNYDIKTTLSDKVTLLGEGLTVLSHINKGTVDVLNYLKLVETCTENEIYKEILQYIKDNAGVEVVRTAASNLLNKQEQSEVEFITMTAVQQAGEYLGNQIINDAIKKVWFLNAAKFGFDLGNLLANTWFHTQDIVKQKSVMRMSAYIGEAISSWTLRAANESISSQGDYSKAEKVVCGLEVLSKVRLHGEEALAKMCSYLIDKNSEKYVKQCIAYIKGHQKDLQSFKYTEMELMRIGCPVDVEVLDVNGNIVVTIPDGQELEGSVGNVNYSAYYSSITGDYTKLVLIPEGEGYSYRVTGNSVGRVSCDIGREDDNGALYSVYKDELPVASGSTINIIPEASLDKTEFEISMNNETSEFGLFAHPEDNVSAENLIAEEEKIDLYLGEQHAVYYSFYPINTTNQKVLWTSEDNSIAEIDENGIVTAKGCGSTSIKGVSEDGGFVISIPVNVSIKQYKIIVSDEIEHGIVEPDRLVALEGETVSLKILPDDGYVLNEISVMDADGSITIDNKSFVMRTSDVTVSAVFSTTVNEYSVTFNSNGGTDVAEQKVAYYHTVSKPSDPTKDGVTFAGWFKDEALTTAWRFETDVVAGDMTLYAKWMTPETATVGKSLELNDSIKIRVQIRNLTHEDHLEYYHLNAVFNGITTIDGTLKDLMNSGQVVYSGERYRAVVAAALAPQIIDKVHITFSYVENQHNPIIISEFDYSVQQYCENMIQKAANDKLTALCKATLDYGAYAQKAFNYKTDNLANINYSAGASLIENTVIGETYNKSQTIDTCTGIISTGKTLNLQSATELRIKFRPVDINTFSDYTFSVDGHPVTAVVEDGRFVVKIPEIKAPDLDHEYEVAITHKDGSSMRVVYSPMAYCYNMQNSGNNATALLTKAFYLYHIGAKNYFG